jgi:hypothetical protein
MYKGYWTMFEQSPDLHCKLASRITVGNHVLDVENVTGRMGNADVSHIVAIDRIEDGLIKHVRFNR